jgi:hypothetical protein
MWAGFTELTMVEVRCGLGIASYGSFGFALMSCANLRQTIHLLLRYGQVLFEPRWAAYEPEGGLLLRANITAGTATAGNRIEVLECVCSGEISVWQPGRGCRDTTELFQAFALSLL